MAAQVSVCVKQLFAIMGSEDSNMDLEELLADGCDVDLVFTAEDGTTPFGSSTSALLHVEDVVQCARSCIGCCTQ